MSHKTELSNWMIIYIGISVQKILKPLFLNLHFVKELLNKYCTYKIKDQTWSLEVSEIFADKNNE